MIASSSAITTRFGMRPALLSHAWSSTRQRGLSPVGTRSLVSGTPRASWSNDCGYGSSRRWVWAGIADSGGPMYTNIVVGTDGSVTASKAVRTAADLAAISTANLVVVSAFRPVPEERLRSERAGAPADVAYMVNQQEDVDRILGDARKLAESRGVKKVITE